MLWTGTWESIRCHSTKEAQLTQKFLSRLREAFPRKIICECGDCEVFSLAFWSLLLAVGMHFPSHPVWLHNLLWPMKCERNYGHCHKAEASRASVCSTTLASAGHNIRGIWISISLVPRVTMTNSAHQTAWARHTFLLCKPWRSGGCLLLQHSPSYSD